LDTIEHVSQRELRGRTKSARIANYLEELILTKVLQEGELLPSQSELAEKFDASSRSIREAFKHLEAKGLLSISQGRRASVKCNNLDQFVESLTSSIIRSGSSDTKLLLDLVQVRTSVEVSAAREFSRNPKRKEVVRDLADIVSKMVRTLEGVSIKDSKAIEQYRQHESAFHKVLIRSNGNIILDAIYENLAPMLDEVLVFSATKGEEFEKKAREYQYIVEALENGQTDLAVALVLVNLTDVKKKIENHAESAQRRASLA
jgi:DNA-binding FadR family transcriptional regulator